MKTPKFLPIISLFLGLSLNLEASSATWNGGTSGTVWDTDSNWTPSNTYPNATGDVATFDSSVSALPTSAVSLGKNITVEQLNLAGTGSLTITDSTDTLTFGTATTDITTGAGQNVTLNVATVVTGSPTINLGSGSVLTFGGTSTLTLGNGPMFLEGSGTTTIGSGVTISGTGGSSAVRLYSSGSVLNVNTSSYAGTLNTNGGVLQAEAGILNLGANQSDRITIGGSTFAAAATYITTTGVNVSSVVDFQGTSNAGSAASADVFTLGLNVTGAATGTFSGSVSLLNSNTGNSVTDIFYANTSNTLTFSGTVGNSTPTGTLLLQKTGGGTVILGHANTFTATTSVTSGTLSLNSNQALQDATLSTGAGGVVTLGSSVTTLTLGGLSGSQNLSGTGGQITSGYTGTVTALTLQPQTGVSDTYSGTIADGHSGMTLTISGAGTQTLSGSNTYSGGTTVNAGGTLFVTNSNPSTTSATGSGSLTIAAGATFGGNGSSLGTASGNPTFAIGSSSTGTATVYIGQTSVADTNTTGTLTVKASSTTASTIQNANLVFNLDSTTPGAGNKLSVGNTEIAFNTTPNVANTTLTLNLQGAGIIAPNTPYILIAGTAGGSANGGLGQYSGFSISGANNIISGLTLTFGGSQPPAWYANSYLFLVNNGSNVDDIEVAVIPEPSTWAMMLGGLAILVFWQRRKNGLR